MTVPVPGSLTFTYLEDGSTTVFSYPVRFLEASELLVIREAADGVRTTLVYNSDYTVSGAGNANGGSITRTAVTNGGKIIITRSTIPKQLVDLKDAQRNPAEAVEIQLDRMAMAGQDLRDRALALAPGVSLSEGHFPEMGPDGFRDGGSSVDIKTAQANAALAAAALALFNTQYLGAYASHPTTDPNGGAIQQGAFYWNTASKTWFYWDGTGWGTFPFATVADGAVTAAKLADDAVTEQKHATGSVSTRALADGSATEAKIADGAVTEAKIRGPIGTLPNALNPKYGIAGDGVTDDTEAIQALIDQEGAAWFPNATYKITDTIELDDYVNLYFQSHLAIIQGDIAVPLIAAKNRLTDRRFFIGIHGGRFDGVSKKGGCIGIDFSNVTDGHVWGSWVYNCQVGYATGGDYGGPGGAVSAYYNRFNSFLATSCTTGIRNGTLGNANTFNTGRITDCVVGTEDDDNSDTTYNSVQIETFTAYGSRISNSGAASTMVRILNGRYENPSVSGAYAGATAIRVNPAAISTRLRDNYLAVVATGISDSGVDTGVSGNKGP